MNLIVTGKAVFRLLPLKLLKIMKLTAILLLIGAMQVSARSYSQAVSISGRNMTLKNVFRIVHKQTGLEFVYDEKKIEGVAPITLNFKDAQVADVLGYCLKGQQLAFSIKNGLIAVYRAPAPVVTAPAGTPVAEQQNAIPPSQDIHGRVLDEKQQPLEGVSIVLKGNGVTKGTTTGADGRFSLDHVPQGKYTVAFSMVGHALYEKIIHVTDAAFGDLSITLQPLARLEDEMVVVAYGTQKKIDLTGAVSTVTAAQLQDRPVTGVANALQGTMPGVTVVQNNGQPGRDAGSVRINGIGTLNNPNPLVVVDGIIVSSMNDVNASDIESISVLKDAASAAIYGSRATNGVIVITTKKGKKGTNQIQYSAYVGKQTPTRLPDYLPSWQAATMYNQALANVGTAPFYTQADIQAYKDGSDPDGHPNTDWLGMFYNKSGIQQNHYLSLNGGNEKTQYLFSLGYFDQQGNVAKTKAQRYTARLNLTTTINSRLKAGGNISYTYNPFQEPLSSYPGVPGFSQMIRQINRISPTVTNKYSNGFYGYIGDGNPIAWLNSPSLNRLNRYALQGSANLDWEIVKDLHFKPLLGYTLTQNQNKAYVADVQFYDHTTGLPALYQGPNNETDHYDNTSYITLQALLDYTKRLGGHTFKIMGGYSQEYTKYTELNGYRQNFLNNLLNDLNAASTVGQTSSGYSDELALQSWFGRFNYDYEGKYYFEANLRYDGSSRFDTTRRWGAFPSLSAGWQIAREDFFSPLKPWFSNLKLRGSWGQLGNQTLKQYTNPLANSGASNDNYPYIALISPGQNYTLGWPAAIAAGVAPVKGANPSIQWETTTATDLGFDAAFFQNALTFTADYFVKQSKKILLDIPVAATYGQIPPIQNGAAVQNKGWEFIVAYHGRKNEFTYDVSANAAFIQNKVTDLSGTGPNISGATIQKVGLPINSFWGYQVEGIFQNAQQVADHAPQGPRTGPGDLMYKKQNGTGKIDPTTDKVYLGTSFPKVTYGFTLGAGWKGIDFTAFFQGAAGVKSYVGGALLGQIGTTVGKPTSAMLNSWTPSNPHASFPRLLTTSYSQNDPGVNPSSFWVRNAGYLRLKNLQLGYTIPQDITKRMGLQRVRFYYSGQNILTFTQFYKWVDPEGPSGSDSYYPQVKTNTVGVNVTF